MVIGTLIAVAVAGALAVGWRRRKNLFRADPPRVQTLGSLLAALHGGERARQPRW